MKEFAKSSKPKDGVFSRLLREPDLNLKVRLIVLQNCTFDHITHSDAISKLAAVFVHEFCRKGCCG